MPPAMAEQDSSAATSSALALFASGLSCRRYGTTPRSRLPQPQPTCGSHPPPDWARLRCRFGDEDLRVLEAALSAGADVPALLATRSAARRLLQSSAAEAFASTATGSVLLGGGSSLAVADFFARAAFFSANTVILHVH
jgi:hypothetical protein